MTFSSNKALRCRGETPTCPNEAPPKETPATASGAQTPEAEASTPRSEHWSLAFGVALLFLFAAAYVHQPPAQCPTALSRLDLLHALARGKVNIDTWQYNTPDKAEHKGHFYSDKAPGTAALALPAFTAGAIALRAAGVALDSDVGWLFSSWIACVGSIGIVAAVGASMLFTWLSKWAGPKCSLVATLAVFLGAAPLPYSTMMFSHAMVVGFVALALWATRTQRESGVRSAGCPLKDWFRANRWSLVAGFASGWALASEYTAGLVVIAIFFWLVLPRWRWAFPFCLAALPPLLLIPLYSLACFKSPFVLPYSLNASFPEMKEGLYAIKWPSLETAYNLLFSPTRGLFFWTPFLLIAAPGYWELIRTNRPAFWLTYGVPLLQIIVISGRTWDWPAGPTLGPRYLAPLLPLLALPCALGVQRFPRVGMVLGAASILLTTLATLTNAAPPFSYYNPLTELHIPLLLKGELAPNLGTVCGLPPWLSVVVYYAILCGGIWWLWRRLPPEPPAAAGASDRGAETCMSHAT